ncbi:serine/threonine-protein kinase ATM [Condylostylus longicornis]|uniref:serine/threonine-protein kinase ATM n=1 Tax=Condylostylus longicornis TaxID=2530218 RepID=UPI00244DB94A|nr:serine/threonine-protein kinase ATM [Condylostylus longicornis]
MSIYDNIHRELLVLSQGITSVKILDRNKSVDRLGEILTSSKDEISYIMCNSRYNSDLSWSSLYNAGVESIVQHSQKLDSNVKGYQTSLNKIPIYSSLLYKIIESSYECKRSKNISANTLYQGILTLIRNRLCQEHFGKMVLHIIEETLFSEKWAILADLRIDDYVELINCVFALAAKNEKCLNIGLKCAVKGIEMGLKSFQFTHLLFEILLQVRKLTLRNQNDDKVLDYLVKLNLLILKELAVDGHQKVLKYYVETIESFCGFYKPLMRQDSKEILFQIYELLLDINFSNKEDIENWNSNTQIDWSKISRKLFYVVETEIKERHCNSNMNEERSKSLENLAVKVLHLKYIEKNIGASSALNESDDENLSKKLIKNSTSLADILDIINVNDRIYNQPIWFAVLVKFLHNKRNLIDVISHKTLLEITVEFSKQNFDILNDIRSVKYLVQLLLEQVDFFKTEVLDVLWSDFVIFVVKELTHHQDGNLQLMEKQKLLQLLIKYEKVDFATCADLIKYFLNTKKCYDKNNLQILKEMFVNYGTSIVIQSNLNELFRQLYSASVDLVCYNDNEYLTCLGEVTVILVLNNFDNLDKNFIHSSNGLDTNFFQNENSEMCKAIQFKYLKHFVALESRKNDKILKTNISENKVNYLNEKKIESLLENVDFQLTENCKLTENLNKIEKLITLIENFSKFNVAESDTEACPLKKKFGLFIQRICSQMETCSNQILLKLGDVKIFTIVKQVLRIVIKIKEIRLFSYSEKYICDFVTFIKSLLNFLKVESLNWDSEIVDDIKINAFEVIAVMVEFDGFKENSFQILNNCDLFESNSIKIKNPKNIEAFFDVLRLLSEKTEFSNVKVANWVLEKLEIICKIHHNNLYISTKIIDSLYNICKSLNNFPDSIVDIFIILSSFLKICYKSKFHPAFNSKVILLLKDVAQICPNLILNNEDIRELYTKSIGKFFSSSSLKVKFSVVECVSYLLDPKWFCGTLDISDDYVEFSRDVYKSVNWEMLLSNKDTDDEMDLDKNMNINSSIIQLFFALFGFSYVNGHLGFLELADFCKNNNLKQSFFKDRHLIQFAEYFGCEFENLSVESCKNLILFWFKQNFKLDELPWFLYYRTEKKFYEQNLETLVFNALKTNKGYISEIEAKINTNRDVFLRNSLEKCYAFILPFSLKIITPESDYVLINSDYVREVNNLIDCLKSYNINLCRNSKLLQIDLIVYSLLNQYSDNKEFFKLTNFKTHFSNIEDFDFETLQYSLCNLIDKNVQFCDFAESNPYVMIKLFERLKWNIFQSHFIKEKLLWICRYLTIIDLLDIREIENDTSWFFAKDIIYFISSVLKKFNDDAFIFKPVLNFIENFLKNLISSSEKLEDEFFLIINQVIGMVEDKNKIESIYTFCLNFLENIFCWIIESKNQLLSRLEPLMEKEIFEGTSIEIHCQRIPSISRKTILEDLNEFIGSTLRNNYTISKLNLNINKKKKEFLDLLQNPLNQKYILQIFDILINIIISGENKESNRAVECLGTIGPVFVGKYAFLKENENENCYENEETFEKIVVKAIERIMFAYNTKSYSAILSLADIITQTEKFKIHAKSERFLQPFFKKPNSAKSNENLFSNQVNVNLKKIIHEKANEKNYENFLRYLTSKIFKKLKWPEFEAVATDCYEFDNLIILPLFKFLLKNNETFKNSIIEMLEHFYQEACHVIANQDDVKKNYLNKRTIKLMLDITELYRIQNNFNISINLLNAANVAAYQQAYFLSIFYLEMWAMNKISDSSFTSTNNELLKNSLFQKIALQVYKAIDCKAAINGFLNPVECTTEFYNNNNDWTDILLETDASESWKNSPYLIDILKRNGLLSISTVLQEKFQNQIDYETYWRLGNWDIQVQDVNPKSKNCIRVEALDYQFEKNHYAALKALKDKDETNTKRSTECAKTIIMRILKETSIESMQNFYKHLTNLMLLRQIEEFSIIQYASSGKSSKTPDLILSNWDLEYEMRYGNFESKERTMAQKITLFELSGTRAQRKISEKYADSNVIARYLLNMVENCNSFKSSENVYLTKRYLCKLKNVNSISEEMKCRTDLINAHICIQNGRKQMGLEILRSVIKEPSTPHSVLYRIDANRLLGKYLAESNDESFDDLQKKYFNKTKISLEKLEAMITSGNIKNIDMAKFSEVRKNLYKNIAEYADREYQLVNSHIKSDDFQKSIEIMEKNRNDAELIKRVISPDAPDCRINTDCYITLVGNSKLDANNIKYFQESCSKYLQIALEHYIEFCKMDNAVHSSTIYRIIGLWFSNKTDEKINAIIKLSGIPSYKFVNVLSQLTAQLNSNELIFIEILKDIIVKCVLDYPHHTLSHIICLDTSNEDRQYFGHKKSKNLENDLRLQRVRQIVNNLKRDEVISELISQIHPMFINLIECAYWNMQKPSEVRKQIRNFNISQKLQKMKNLDKVHCPTVTLKIPLTTHKVARQEIVSIIGWDSKYEPAGGINAPKKIYCNCSDGIKRPQLLKGNDDLRQDAIMLQVLQFVNNLLKQENEGSNLSIRTYKVVPLSKRSGLIEWCVNTVPLGYYLCGNNKMGGAHAKYKPNNKSVAECREALKNVKDDGPETRIKCFIEICKKIQPVLHYFFFERFKTPGEWFERRLAYMNSVSTTSMIGYILGLGDRHCQNILLDEKTAEVIHIDFGIAFEKGKLMPTPETIPFRLTREIVAPMGICEVKGIFKNSCENTLQILRNNSQVLLIILEVLLHDPLYSWSVNDKIVKRINDESDGAFHAGESDENNAHNATAYRALMRVQNKLEGRTERQIGSFSVSTHVEKLIAEARNVKNLGLLYCGWDPYL